MFLARKHAVKISIRGTQPEYSSKPLKQSIVKRSQCSVVTLRYLSYTQVVLRYERSY